MPNLALWICILAAFVLGVASCLIEAAMRANPNRWARFWTSLGAALFGIAALILFLMQYPTPP